MFFTVPLSIIRRSFTVHSAMVYIIQVCRQLSSNTRMKLHGVPWISILPKTCRVSCQNTFVKLVHLVGFNVKETICILCTFVQWMDIFFTERVRHPKKNGNDCMGSALEMRFTTSFLETVASLASMRARASHMLASTHTESMYCFFMKQDTAFSRTGYMCYCISWKIWIAWKGT